MNSITIMGRLTRDPELRQTNSGTPVTSFTVAVDRRGKEKATDFLDCVAWNDKAEFVHKYFGKGRMILVAGRLQIRDWTDKEGNKRRTAEIVANDVYFCGDRQQRGTEPQGVPDVEFEDLSDDDLPF